MAPNDTRPDQWQPKTRLGRLVKEGEVTSMKQAIETGLPVREPEIVDILMDELEDDVIDVNMVQRMTDSGRRVRFRVVAAIGNHDGLVGLGQAKGSEVGPTIRKAIDVAKLDVISVRRGCGSWECGCRRAHTVPFEVSGKAGSVGITLKPSPRGVGLATGDVAKQILTLAGIEDVWAFADGSTRTTVNYAKATFEALRQTALMRIPEGRAEALAISDGPVIQ
jgi:small subunit ribosomal protein S5